MMSSLAFIAKLKNGPKASPPCPGTSVPVVSNKRVFSWAKTGRALPASATRSAPAASPLLRQTTFLPSTRVNPRFPLPACRGCGAEDPNSSWSTSPRFSPRLETESGNLAPRFPTRQDDFRAFANTEHASHVSPYRKPAKTFWPELEKLYDLVSGHASTSRLLCISKEELP